MEAEHEILTSGIGEVSLQDGIVFMTLLGKSPFSPQKTPEVIHELALTPGGFIDFYAKIEETVRHLVNDGVLVSKEDAEDTGDVQ